MDGAGDTPEEEFGVARKFEVPARHEDGCVGSVEEKEYGEGLRNC